MTFTGRNKFVKVLKDLAGRNYYTSKAIYKYQLKKNFRSFRKPPLLIYQMGKVGSSSVMRSLPDFNLCMPIYHLHYLTKKRILETENKRKIYFNTEKHTSLQRPWMKGFLREQFDNHTTSLKWKVITLTREPVSRNISTFFENLNVVKNSNKGEYVISSDYYGIDSIVVKNENIDNLIDMFFEKLNHNSPLEFFDKEIKTVLGIDVFKEKFKTKSGYGIYENDKVKVLLLRLEDLNVIAKKAFKEFLNIDNFIIKNANIGEEKVYAPIYKFFKEKVSFPKSYLEKLYNSKYTLHFYSNEEINRFRKRWKTY